MFLVVSMSIYVFVCMCVYICSCKPQHSLAEHNTYCMYEPQSETAPARTPQSIANGELSKTLLWSQNLLP